MTQYNTLNVEFPNSRLKNLKPAIKSGSTVTLNLSSYVVGDANYY